MFQRILVKYLFSKIHSDRLQLTADIFHLHFDLLLLTQQHILFQFHSIQLPFHNFDLIFPTLLDPFHLIIPFSNIC